MKVVGKDEEKMNTSLYFNNLTDEEIIAILNVVSVPYLMEPLVAQADKYLGGNQHKSPSREAVNHLYLHYLRDDDPDLSLFLSDVVVDIIHYFKLSEGFKNLLSSDDPTFVKDLSEKIRKRQCPITVDMFMRLLDEDAKPTEPKFYDFEKDVVEQTEAEEPEAVTDEPEVVESVPVEVVENSSVDYEVQIKDLQYQIMNLEMENQSLKEENRHLLFQNEDEDEIRGLKIELEGLKGEKEELDEQLHTITEQNVGLQKDLTELQDYKKKYNQVLLEIRDYKIKYISLQAEMDQLRYTMKNDSKKLKELQNKQRSVYDNEADWMMAMHDLTWYKKEWNLPGDAPLHKIWAHLNREEARQLAHLLKNYDRLLRTERKKEIDALKEILIVKEAILILLKSDKAIEQARQDVNKK